MRWTLVRVRLMKDEYMGTGLVSDMTFRNVYTAGTLDATTGTITKDYGTGRGDNQGRRELHAQ